MLLQKAHRSLQAAKVLNQTDFPEFTTSRAYYAMFYVAEAFLAGEGLSFSKHSTVIAGFGQQFARTGHISAEFHRYLIAAELRIKGDYNIEPSLTEEQAIQQISRAEKFLELAEQLKLDNP